MARTMPDDLATPITDRMGVRGGLTKREEFAKAAMQGILADSKSVESEAHIIAHDAVVYADALIEALNKDAE